MRLTLGTAQFGSNYGVCNSGGKVGDQEIQEILAYAFRSGITKIDTASGYGDAEQVLGRNLRSNNWEVSSKLPSLSKLREEETVGNFLHRELTKSLKHLNRCKIDTLLVHGATDLLSDYGEEVYGCLHEFKNNNLAGKIGVSVYDASQIDRILSRYNIDVIQLPLSILDQRLYFSGHLNMLKDLDIEIYARSIFLQGILIQDIGEVPEFFLPISGNIQNLQEVATSKDMSPVELCVAFVHSLDQLDGIIVGVDSQSQLEEIVNASNKSVETEFCRGLALSDVRYLNPTLWNI